MSAAAPIEAAPPPDPAVTLFGQGKSAAEIWSALVAGGAAPDVAEAHVKILFAAVALLDQGKPKAEIWSALVASGVTPAAAEALVRDLGEVRRRQLAKRREEEEVAGSGFCKKCHDESTPESPGNISSTNGTGTMFYGDARRCGDCGSVVRVHWVVFCHLPIIPLGTYRYRALSGDGAFSVRTQFVARRTQQSSEQIAMHYAVTVAVLVALFAFAAISRSGRR